MAKRTHKIIVDGQELQLRLTNSGLRALNERFGRSAQELLFQAAGDAEVMSEVLRLALNWKGNENPIQDGEELYDLMVDEGFAGQSDFGRLAISIGVASGVWSREEGEQFAQALDGYLKQQMNRLNGILEDEEEDTDPPPKRGK